jgi:hypothetical protein
MFTYSQNEILSWSYATLAHAGASYIAAYRAIDGQHHWSDVGVASFVGSLISWSVFNQMERVMTDSQSERNGFLSDWEWSPHLVSREESGASFPFLTFDVKKELP